MATQKITKKAMFTALLAIPAVSANADMVDFITHEIALLDKKATSKKPTQTQTDNEHFKTIIIDYLRNVCVGKCIKELQAEIPELTNLTNQRITHLLTPLVNDHILTKTYDKKTPYFSYNFDIDSDPDLVSQLETETEIDSE